MTFRALWVDDDADAYPAVLRVLGRQGVEVTVCYDIEQALENTRALAQADLILLDLLIPVRGMPVGAPERYPGLWLLKKLREDCHAEAPAIVFSIVPESRIGDRRVELGIVEFVEKTTGLAALEHAVARHVSGRDEGDR